MRALLASLALLLCACPRGGKDRAPAPADAALNGATSPAGDRHPGKILQEDRVGGRTWTDAADAVPQAIAWFERDGKWVPVVRIVVTGNAATREVTRFGPDGEALEHTVLTAPPPQP